MEKTCKNFLCLLLALVMVIGLMPVSQARAEAAAWQVASAAATDLGLDNVGDSAKFVIVSAVSPNLEMVANIGTNGAGQTGFELAPRTGAENAVWTITKVENGYTVSNGGLNVAIMPDHQVALEADAVVQIKKGNNGTDDWVIYNGSWCLNDHDSFSGAFEGSSNALSTYTNLVGGRSMLKLYPVTEGGTEPEPSEPDDEAITLTVDVNDPQRIIDSASIFGINHRYAFNGYGSFDSETMQVKADFKALYEDAGFGSIRYPGGTISNLFNWKTTIGPVDQRKNQIHGFYNNAGQGGIAPNFGLTEIATFAEDVESEIVYVYSLGRGSAQDAADLMEYLNAKVGTNPNGGIDWAAVRAANGHEEPYNVRYFEIGNEMQQAWAGSDGTGSQGYWLTAVSSGAETAYIDGGTAVFDRQYAVCEEDWNEQASKSTGEKNMVRYMRYANGNPMKYDENGNVVVDPDFRAVNDSVSVYVGGTQWTLVESLDASGPSDKHCVVDYSTGAIRFGDGQHGAIPGYGQQITVSYSVEREGFLAVSQAIKNTIAKINELEGTDHEAHVYSSFETVGFISKMQQRGADEWYDGLTIHPYSGDPGGSGASFYDSAMRLAENVGIQKVREYVDMMPADKVPVISEYGIFRSTDPLVRSQTHAIYIAKVLMEYVRLGSPYIQKHCLIDWYSSGADSLGPTQQAVIQAVPGADANTVTGEGTFTFFSTPSAHVFKMLNAGFGDTIVFSEFSEVPAMSGGAKALSALASTDADSNIYIAIVNASRTEDYPIALDLQGISAEGATVTAQILTTENFGDQNSPEDPDKVSVQELTLDGEWTQVIPKHTFVVLKIDPAAELDDTTVVGSFAVDPAELPTRGGQATVSITGRNLPEGITVQCGDATVATTGNSIRQTAVLTFPANTGKEDVVYAIRYSLDGVTFEGDLSVTVAVDRYDADDPSRDIPVSVLTAAAGDEQTGYANEGPAHLVLDGDVSTIWHTNWYGTSRANHWIQFELSEDYVVDGLRYQPRQGSTNGIITEYRIQISDDGENFETVKSGTWEGNSSWKIASFGGVQARFVRLVAVDALTDNNYVFASAAEIRLTGVKAGEAPHEHEWSDWTQVTAPTCTEAGAEERSCACGETETREIAALGHSYEAVVTAPTCTEGGYTTYTCSVCGDSYVADETEALGHKHVNGVCECGDTLTSKFEDVKAGQFYFDPVEWAVEKGITTGTDATHFTPDGKCQRAAVVTFLWRAAGSPEPTSTTNPFTDVKEGDFFYKAVLWAVENNITNGTSATTFSPLKECNRAEVVTFLYRSQGNPTVTNTENPFSDVDVNAFYGPAVLWAVENNITNGMGDGTFGITAICNRAQVVTFLYRTMVK